jgi:lauroyl/myristoyl acyltransferase
MPGKKERRANVTWLLPLFTLFQWMLPRWVVVHFARFAGVLACRFDRQASEALKENCRHVLGPGTSDSEIEATVRRLFFHYILNLLDLLRGLIIKHRVRALVEFDRREADRTMAENRGIIIVTGHIGNHELAGVYLAASGYPISAVFEPVPGGWTEAYNRYRNVTAMGTIPMTDPRAMIKVLREHRMLALVSDRDLTGNGILCPAFDSYRYYPKGAAVYSLRFRVPMVVAAMVFQHEPGRRPYRLIYKQVKFTPTADANGDVAALTRLIAAEQNELIRRFPDQWLVFRGAWQQQP